MIRPLLFSGVGLLLYGSVHAELLLSEVMADPAAVPDASGEYLELGNSGDKELFLRKLSIAVDGDTLVFPDVKLSAGGVALLCRDSLPERNGGMACDRKAERLRLANGRPIAIVLRHDEGDVTYEIPAARSGQSWENTWDEKSGYSRFALANGIHAGGDKGSPGHSNSVSVVPPLFDLALTEITFRKETREARLRIENRGRLLPDSASVSLISNRILNGIPHAVLKTRSLDISSCRQECTVPFLFESGGPPVVNFALSGDSNPLNDTLLFVLPEYRRGGLLRLTEVCAAPTDGAPEWVEIRNGSSYAIAIGDLRLQDRLVLGEGRAATLKPGEYLVLTEDEKAFREIHGGLKLRLVQPPSWRVLRNTGDTVRLALPSGTLLDSVAYRGFRPSDNTGCLERMGEDLAPVLGESHVLGSTPGFEKTRDKPTGWKISPRILRTDEGGRIDIQVTASPQKAYRLEIFDLSGYSVRAFCSPCTGSRSFSWKGEDERGKSLPVGPYIVLFHPQGDNPHKKSLVISRKLR